MLGVAQTGTGKTAAYLLPVLSKLDDGGYPKDAINCVIMSPTRELAQQIDQAMQGFGYYLQDVSSVAVYGGNDGNRYDQELKSLRMGADVVIATPGRLITHISLGNVDLSKVSFFILDEADRMLDMGFSEDINTIAAKLPKTCQTIMFSATMPEKIEELAKSLLKDPVEIKLAVSKPAEKIKQEAYVCYETQKMTLIKDIFKAGDMKRVIIFSGSKMKVKQLAAALQQTGINCGAMHSDLEQTERDDVMFKFKSGQYDVLVATDIVARGIDIDDIEMVINYDVPHDTEDYVHRIGRTARANRDGRAITFVNEEDMFWFQQIEKFLEKVVEKMPLPEGCGEGPEYIKLNKPSKKGGRGGKGGNGRKGNGRGGNENGEKTKAKTDARKTASRLLISISQTTLTTDRRKLLRKERDRTVRLSRTLRTDSRRRTLRTDSRRRATRSLSRTSHIHKTRKANRQEATTIQTTSVATTTNAAMVTMATTVTMLRMQTLSSALVQKTMYAQEATVVAEA